MITGAYGRDEVWHSLRYDQVYKMAEQMNNPQTPWVVDYIDAGVYVGEGMTVDQQKQFFADWMYTHEIEYMNAEGTENILPSWYMTRPAGWVPYEDRIVKPNPEPPTTDPEGPVFDHAIRITELVISHYTEMLTQL